MELSEPEEDLPIDNLDTKSENSDADDDTALPVSLYPPHYVHHLSFWISDELSDSLLAQIINTSIDYRLETCILLPQEDRVRP